MSVEKIEMEKNNNIKSQNIDIVYTWCDSSDENLLKKREKFAKEEGIDFKLNDKCRYINNNELMYSLRSLELYAPWINNIYIVVDNQIPKWLNLSNPKIKIIDHKDIMPEDALPTFNSRAIEHCIVNIENLSENFLYANDDCFFWGPVEPDFFIKQNNKIIYRFVKEKVGKEPEIPYIKSLKTALDLLKAKPSFYRLPHHNIDMLNKTCIKECYSKFKTLIDNTIRDKFRKETSISRFIYNYYACIKNYGEFKIISRIDTYLPLYRKIYNFINKKYSEDSLSVGLETIYELNLALEKLKPKLLCINDQECVTDKDREQLKPFLESKFPDKSSFEIL